MILEVTDLILNIPQSTQVPPYTFSLSDSKLVWVRGENGAGKSTLLKTLLGVIRPRGKIRWPQGRPSLYYLGASRYSTSTHPIRILPLASGFGSGPKPRFYRSRLNFRSLSPLAHRPTGQLSRGQQQRLLLACALLSQAKLWLLDEPLTALNIPSRETLIQCLHAHKAQGGSALIVSHHPLLESCDEVLDVLV